MTSIPELQGERTMAAFYLRAALAFGSNDTIVKCANYLLEIDEQLNHSKDVPMTWKCARTLPAITPFEKRALHMGADPATIYTPEDLKLYQEIKEREAVG